MRKVPKLRFKEFSNEWEEKKLEEISELIDGDRGKNYPNEKEILEKGILFLSTSNFSDNKLILNKKNRYISQEKFDLLTKGKVTSQDLIITLRGSIGNIVVFENDKFSTAFINAQMMIIRPNINNKYYLYYLFQTLKSKKEIENMSSGSAQPQLTKKDLKSFKLFYPSFQEQEKIANFLSSVDKKISLIEEKLELFKEYKKGVMQKIFSQELRFKDNEGNDYPEWEEKRLGDILEEYIEKSTINNQYQTLSSTATGLYLQEEYFNRQIASVNNIGYKILLKNQLVFSPQNLWLGNININIKYERGIVSPSYKIFNLKGNIILINYFKNLIKIPRMLEAYKNASEQGASVVRRNLDMEQFMNIYINLPTLEEQQKIADFLSSIDTKIEKIEKKLENLKEFKKGLLQQMFV